MKIYTKVKSQKVVYQFFLLKELEKSLKKIQVSKEDLAELSPSAQPDVNVDSPSEAEENDDVSLDQVSEAEEQVSDNVSDEENNS